MGFAHGMQRCFCGTIEHTMRAASERNSECTLDGGRRGVVTKPERIGIAIKYLRVLLLCDGWA
ncbi:hypothetical protein KSD_46320 [Ktedonobacter sp. SOSP1-85]|nr:hypothetical protein KSD_46320 [Ktedonobacter sp. SOSP1-85]